MRRVLLTTIALLAVAATAAVAADLPRAMPAKAPAYVPVGYNWTGFYVGINGGYGWGRSHWSGFRHNARIRRAAWSAAPSATTGRRRQPVGVRPRRRHRLDQHQGHLRECRLPDRLPDQERLAWHRARPRRLRLGPRDALCHRRPCGRRHQGQPSRLCRRQRHQCRLDAPAPASKPRLAGNWTAKLEYLYVDLGHINCALGAARSRHNVDFHADEVRAGVNYRF